MYPSESKELTREELYQKVWPAPRTQTAASLGVSGVALAKRCKKLNLPKPPLGYLAKVDAGQKPQKAPLPPTSDEVFMEGAKKPLGKTLSLPETSEQLNALASKSPGISARLASAGTIW